MLRPTVEIISVEQLLILSVAINCLDYLLRSAVKIMSWDQLLRPPVEISCWHYLLRSAVEITCSDQLLRFPVQDPRKQCAKRSAVEAICWDPCSRFTLSVEINSWDYMLNSVVETVRQNHFWRLEIEIIYRGQIMRLFLGIGRWNYLLTFNL